MPRKIRELKARLRKAGFEWQPGKGSHTTWRHTVIHQVKFTLSGRDGDDAKPYQVRDVEDAIRKVKELQSE